MVQELPDSCGVYLLKRKGKVLYVGKALSIKKRIASHKQSEDPKIQALLSIIDTVEPILCDNEVEALILENALVKKHEPPFNMRLKDDTSYPYIKITHEEFPRVLVVREPEKKEGLFYGPFTDVASTRNTLKAVREIFPFRTTRKKITGKDRPCLNYHLKLCSAPCAGKIGEEDYNVLIKNVCAFLEGRYEELERSLADDMNRASEVLDFEHARILRDKLFAIRRTMEGQKISELSLKERDIVGMASSQDISSFAVLQVRHGTMNDARKITVKRGMGSEEDILESFLKQYYEKSYVPKEILLPIPIEDRSIQQWLSQKSEKKVLLFSPKRGKYRKFCEMANRNALLVLSQKTSPLSELERILHLPTEPTLIEAFDISTIFGQEAVGSMVVFENGKPKKSSYRRFRIKAPAMDDISMMSEVISRRYSHTENLPQLIVVDGGVGQLNAANRILEGRDIHVPIMGLAKRNEEIFLPKRKNPIVLGKESYALRLLQAIRDEAHRFAITYHRNLRGKKMEMSLLDDIEGIGSERKKRLISHFKSLENLKSATQDEIRIVVKNRKVSEKIYERMRAPRP
jgi:excinuclease ABC subunit C